MSNYYYASEQQEELREKRRTSPEFARSHYSPRVMSAEEAENVTHRYFELLAASGGKISATGKAQYEFHPFPKIPRLKKRVVITEKIDGTNAQVALFELNDRAAVNAAGADPLVTVILSGLRAGDSPLAIYAGSRNRWITPRDDNFGFAQWVHAHADELAGMGPGRHYGEWYGQGIQSHYFLDHRRLALFNTARWLNDPKLPACCEVVPVLAEGEDVDVDSVMDDLRKTGSRAVPGFMAPEGIVVYHTASRQMYKRTFKQDTGKWAGVS